MSNILEKAFLERILSFKDNNDQLSSDKFGFKKGKLPTNAVVSFTDMVVEGLED